MASGLALRFRSHLLRTASFLQSSLLYQNQAPIIRSPPLVVSSLSDVRAVLGDSSFTLSGGRFLSTARRQPVRSKKPVDIFYVTPTDAMEKYSSNPSKNKFRLGGLVLEGSVVQPASSAEMEFVITDILVGYQGSLTDLFREGHSVVVEALVKPFTEEIKKEISAKSVREG